MPQNKEIDIDRFIGSKPGCTVVPVHIGERVSQKKQDAVVWKCKEDFTITNIRQKGTFDPAKPDNPFYRNLPFAAYSDGANPPRFHVNSGPAQPGTAGSYQVTFKVASGTFDPHFDVDP